MNMNEPLACTASATYATLECDEHGHENSNLLVLVDLRIIPYAWQVPMPTRFVRDRYASAHKERTGRTCALRVILDHKVRRYMIIRIAVACHGVHDDAVRELHVPDANGLEKLAGRRSAHC